ncbi:hypothetical protein EV182_002636, partial [Spiromyces aspiralis]
MSLEYRSIFVDLVDAERKWFDHQDPSQSSADTDPKRDTAELAAAGELSQAGELACLMLGLKPCVLLDLPDRSQLPSYIECVVMPFIRRLNGTRSAAVERWKCSRIQHRLVSPEADWIGTWIAYHDGGNGNSGGGLEALSGPASYETVLAGVLNPSRQSVSEAELALLLDYPGTLPRTPEEERRLVAVSYIYEWPQAA